MPWRSAVNREDLSRFGRLAGVVSRLLSGFLISAIEIYRGLVSPLLGPHCRFHPTCSTYALDAIRKYGPLSGSARALARLGRCHPLNAGGFDPVR
jgi:putative membrane protein insertion efficiency factor